jgi:hypothetical protein
MADAHTGADSLGLWLSGTESAAGLYGPNSSLGGVRLADEIGTLPARYTWSIRNLTIEQHSGYNGEGEGQIRVVSTNSLAYTAPSGTEGATVTIANGETKILPDATASKWVRVTRTSATDLLVNVTRPMLLNLKRSFNNVIGMDNVTSAERAAGTNTYRAFFVTNDSTTALTNVRFFVGTLAGPITTNTAQLSGAGAGTITTSGSFAAWSTSGWAHIKTSGGATREIVYYTSRTSTSLTVPADGRARLGTSAAAGAGTDTVVEVPGIRLAQDTPDGTGAIQAIANESTAPTGVSWLSGTTNTTGISIATMAPGQTYAVWIHREIPVGGVVSAKATNIISVEFTDITPTTFSNTLTGCYRIADSALARLELFVGVDADPTFSSATATSASLPFSYNLTPPVSGNRDYRYTVRQRNQYDLSSFNVYHRSTIINSAGVLVTPEISDPADITLTNVAGGEVDITAVYHSADDTDPADTFLIYITTNGVDPNPASDTPIERDTNRREGGIPFDAMFGVYPGTDKYLSYTVGPYAWGTDLRVLVRMRRQGMPDVDGTNTAIVSTTVSTVEPAIPSQRIAYLGSRNEQRMTSDYAATTSYVSVPNNVYFRMLPGETQFWGDTTLIFRGLFPDSGRARLYIPVGWSLINSSASLGSGTATAHGIEVASWTGPSKILYVIVAGVRRCKIDVTNLEITADQFNMWQTLTDCPVEGPTHTGTTETLFQVFDPTFGRYRSFVSVNSAGLFATASAVSQSRG